MSFTSDMKMTERRSCSRNVSIGRFRVVPCQRMEIEEHCCLRVAFDLMRDTRSMSFLTGPTTQEISNAPWERYICNHPTFTETRRSVGAQCCTGTSYTTAVPRLCPSRRRQHLQGLRFHETKNGRSGESLLPFHESNFLLYFRSIIFLFAMNSPASMR